MEIYNMEKRKNIGWIDVLRILACFLVIFSHCCDPFTAQFDTNRSSFLTAVFSGSLVRSSVPLFVMMTGVLLFPLRMDMKEFYIKRIGRIIIPLIFWSILLPILFFVYLNYIHPATQNMAIAGDHTWSGTGMKLYTFIFNFNFDTTPLWYLYMLVGLYFIMPILNSWLERAKKQEIRLFLWFWGISLVVPYLKMLAPLLGYTGNYGNMGLFGVCDWNPYGTFYYVSGFVGYIILAYYLVKYPLTWSWKRTLGITIPMFVGGYLITSLGFLLTQKYFPGNYANLEIVWYFAGINVFMMTFPVFVIIQKLKIRSSRLLSCIASLTFGIYLCHFIFVQIAYDVWKSSLPAILQIIGMACSVFVISGLIVWGLKNYSYTRRLVS
ncbi:acyltransferase family protein [uncultured Odoribacter sp.]|uniref:acyltransferase n=1 Tax=uncultured Odoribacter sp. TaxID=876416 RepID=UPI00260C8DB7|nr:acyltransferase family protein [uncultured Odoribacter sp.]